LVCLKGIRKTATKKLIKYMQSEMKMIILLFGIFIGGLVGIMIMSFFFIGKREDILSDALYSNIFSTK
jgi:cytosine/uracil/thiamine/allantoin permease